jgi:hypothetical protein
MHQHVKQRKLDLSQGLQAALKILGSQQFVEQGAGQGFARFHMGRHLAQHRPIPAEVFHELAGQLDRVHATPLMCETSRSLTCVSMRRRPWLN